MLVIIVIHLDIYENKGILEGHQEVWHRSTQMESHKLITLALPFFSRVFRSIYVF